MLFSCAALSILTRSASSWSCGETIAFLREVPIREFLFGTEWTPLFSDKHFGVLPLVTGTLLASAIAMRRWRCPPACCGAIYLSEYAPARPPRSFKPVLEMLARRADRRVRLLRAAVRHAAAAARSSRGLSGFNALGPGIVMGIMILPLVSSLSEDALHGVPRGLREGWLRARRDADADRAAGRRAGGVLRHRGGVHPRGVPRDRRDDDRGDRGRAAAAPDAQSAACRSRR